MLEMTAVTKVYRTELVETHALRALDLHVKDGEFVAVTGPSGSGKTTFLNIAGLLENLSGGRYVLDGEDVGQLSDRDRSRLRNRKIGFIFQSFNLIPDLNLFDNVDVPLRYRGMAAAERRQRIEQALARVGLASRMKHYPSELSGGQQQRAAIARALAGEPRLLLADEPTGNLDSQMARGVVELLEEINAAGTTVVMVTHDPELATRAQRNVHIVDGVATDLDHGSPLSTHASIATADRGGPMFGYYLQLALGSLKRNRTLTVLMVLAIALGIGASMTTLTVFHVLSGDPIPQKSERLFYVQLDPESMQGYVPGSEPIAEMSRYDSEALLAQHRAERQAMMTGGAPAVQAVNGALPPFQVVARYTSADFFPMFDLPFAFGGGWSAADDSAHARVAVIGEALNRKLFGGGDSVGKRIRLSGNDFRVIGVLGQWRPLPRFYDLGGDRFDGAEEVYVPIATAIELGLQRQGSMNCWGDTQGDGTALAADCAWLQYWVELKSPADAAAYKRYLDDYSAQQHAAGRFQRPPNTRLRDVMAWLDHNRVVPSDVRLQLWLAFGFLLVCVLNTVGLLLAKFLRRSGEIGVRRALGASRRAIFAQFLVEAGLVGCSGGVLGLGLAWLGLWAVRQQPVGYAELARLDPAMLITTFVIAIGASLLAGLLPAWRAAQITPAIQLKSQ